MLATSRITEIEVRRNLKRLLSGGALETRAASSQSTSTPSRCWPSMPSALRTGASTTLVTFDIRQAQAARANGLHVVGC